MTLVTGRHYELAALPHPFVVDPSIDLWPAIEQPDGRRDGSGPLRAAGRKLRRAARAVRYAWAWERLTRRLLRQRLGRWHEWSGPGSRSRP